jgi:hypothetical protein
MDDFAKHCFLDWFHDSVEVIGHDDPGIKMIRKLMTCHELADKNGGEVCFRQNTFSMPGIQQFMEACGKLAVISMALALRKLIKLLTGPDPLSRQPAVS